MNLIFEHKEIFAVSAIVAGLMISPAVIFSVLLPSQYGGINIGIHGTDEFWYLARGKEVLEGHPLGNAVFREGKNEQDPYFTYNEKILLSPIRWIGLADKIDVTKLFALYNFIGVFLLSCLIYFFVYQVFQNKLQALASSATILGLSTVVAEFQFLTMNIYSRGMVPYFPMLATFLYLNLLILNLKNFDNRRYKILAGLAFGLLFYLYVFAWSFILTFNIILLLLFIIKRDKPNAKNILIITIAGVLLGFYNVFNILAYNFSEAGRQLSYFHWVEYTRAPIIKFAGIASILLLVLIGRKIRDHIALFVLVSLVLGGWAVLNQQVVTGRLLQPDHYFMYFVIPVFIIVFFLAIFVVQKEWFMKYRGVLVAVVLIAAFANTALGQYRGVFNQLGLKIYRQDYRPILDYLNKEKVPGVVLTADDQNAYLVTIYTPHDIFWARVLVIANTPIEKVRDALFIYAYLNRESRFNFRTFMERTLKYRSVSNAPAFYHEIYEALEGYLSGFSYYEYQNKLANNDLLLYQKRNWLLSDLADEYNALAIQKSGMNDLLKKYGINYIVWDRNYYPDWDLSFIEGLTLLTSHRNIYLYKIN